MSDSQHPETLGTTINESGTSEPLNTIVADSSNEMDGDAMEGDDSKSYQPSNIDGLHSSAEMDEDDMEGHSTELDETSDTDVGGSSSDREGHDADGAESDGDSYDGELLRLPRTFHTSALFALVPESGMYDDVDKLEGVLKWGLSDGLPEAGYKVLAQKSSNKDKLPNFDIEIDTSGLKQITDPLRTTIMGHMIALRIMELRLGNHVAKLDKHVVGGPGSPVDNSVQFAVGQTQDLKKKSVEWYTQLSKLWGHLEFDLPL